MSYLRIANTKHDIRTVLVNGKVRKRCIHCGDYSNRRACTAPREGARKAVAIREGTNT